MAMAAANANNNDPMAVPHDTDNEQEQDEPLPGCDNDSASISSLLRSALSNPDQLTAMLSNYSTSYNAVNVGIVLPVLKYSLASTHDAPGENDTSTYVAQMIKRRLQDSAQSDEQDSVVASSLLAGMIFGQMLGGYLGDALGRRNAMMMVMGLQIGASLGGAFIATGDADGGLGALEQLAIWRFILGIGAGGVYPLAAVMSAENNEDAKDETEGNCTVRQSRHQYEQTCANEETHENNEAAAEESAIKEIQSFQRVALTFSMQGLGFITVPLLSYPMLAMHWDIDLIWRLLLGLGSVPGLFVMYLRVFRTAPTSEKGNDVKEHRRSEGGSLELIQPTDEESSNPNDEADSSFQSAMSTLFTDMVDGDPSSHVSEDHQVALVDDSHLDDSERYEGFNDDVNGFIERRNTESEQQPSIEQHQSLWSSIKNEPNLLGKFIGTAGTWFLFDVLFCEYLRSCVAYPYYYLTHVYFHSIPDGNTLFEPIVLEAAFGSKDNVEDGYTLLLLAVRDSLMISFLSLPGYFVTVMVIGKQTCVCKSIRTRSTSRCNSILPCAQTPAYIQMQGFLMMCFLYIILGCYWTQLSNFQGLLLVLYAGSFFFANYGPNSTTFLLPSVTYSKECRSTLNGMSAAAGKLGALVGASAFEPAADLFGESIVMVTCGIVSLFGFALTRVCVGGQKKV
jgi:MFS family permease